MADLFFLMFICCKTATFVGSIFLGADRGFGEFQF
jgi:hypothetical protein